MRKKKQTIIGVSLKNNKVMSKKAHPFYCFKKQCRKTAWDTPEYLTDLDWTCLAVLIGIIYQGNPDLLYHAIYVRRIGGQDYARDFFYRVIGWPEGWSYCANGQYMAKTGFAAIARHLPEMERALNLHNQKTNKSLIL